MSARRWLTVLLSVLVATLSITRAVVYFDRSDDQHPTPYRSVSFDPTGGLAGEGAIPTAVPTDVLTAAPTVDPTAVPSDTPSEAPTETPVGPVRYEISGNGSRASLFEYTTADLGVGRREHLTLPYTKTVAGKFGTYFHMDAEAQNGTSITCRIVAHHGTVEVTRTARGRHALVTCEWNVPYVP